MTKVIEFINDKWKAVLLIAGGILSLLFITDRVKKGAVNSYKERIDEDAARRSIAASDAASDAHRLEPDELAERMRDKGWYRD